TTSLSLLHLGYSSLNLSTASISSTEQVGCLECRGRRERSRDYATYYPHSNTIIASLIYLNEINRLH
ncbi:MAG: hypothetical protein J7K77_01550, partial [Dehalococcoidales bacterium]|nr:hypothetical protein [Dehalococcoidales bacterium]